MKNLIYILILLIFVFFDTLFGQKIPYNKVLQSGMLIRLESHGNKVAGIGYGAINSRQEPLDYFDGQNWIKLHLLFNNFDGKSDSIKYGTAYPDIEFDKNGNLWTCGIGGFFKYENGIWSKFFQNDKYANERVFTRICFDSTGGTWLTSEYGINKRIIGSFTYYDDYVSELIKFDGKNYLLIDSVHEFFSGYGTDYGLITLSDGRVVVHRSSVKKSSQKNDLIIYNPNDNSRIITTLPNPHDILKSGPYSTKFITKIFEDKLKNIWFSLGYPQNINDDTGLEFMRTDGSWYAFSSKDNYPSQYIQPADIDKFPWDTAYDSSNGTSFSELKPNAVFVNISNFICLNNSS